MEEQNRCSLKHSSVKKIQFFKQILIRKFQIIFTHSSTSDCFAVENIKAFFVQIFNTHIFKRNRIPILASFSQKKISQRRTLQKLFCTSSSIMIFTLVIYRIRIFFNSDFDNIKSVFIQQVNINNQSKSIANFIRNIFKKFFRIRYPNNRAVIPLTNIKRTAPLETSLRMRICKTSQSASHLAYRVLQAKLAQIHLRYSSRQLSLYSINWDSDILCSNTIFN